MNENRQTEHGSGRVFAAQTTDEVIAIMREEDEAADRDRILQAMSPACCEKLDYLENWLRREMQHTLRSRYELGCQVYELYEDEKKNGGKLYGKNAIGRICKILRWEDGLIRLTLRFAQSFTPEQVEQLCALVLPSGEPLNWSHLRALLSVTDTSQRQELLDRTVNEGWTSIELAQEIKNLTNGPVTDERGRPPRIPKDFDAAVTQQQQSAEKWERLHNKVWNAPTCSLVTHAAHLLPEEVTAERLHQACELARQLRLVVKHAQVQAEKAEEVVREFERILGRHQRNEVFESPVAGA